MNTVQFYAPYFLNLLWLTPVLAFCFVASGWIANKRVRAFLKTTEIQEKLLPHYEQREWPFRAALLLGAFVFSVIALSQPQWGEEKKKIERKGVDIVFMLDVSTSMLAEDTKPSRVQKSKFEIESFVKALKGDRIGMLTFAGSSFMQTPLTLDYSAFLIFLSGVDVGHVPDPGTSLGLAIQKAIAAFPDEKGKYRALIVFSDGEDHEAQIDPAIDEAKKKNVRIYTVGTATAEGAPIPLKDGRGTQTSVKKDRAGNIVITKLNKELLTRVAAETGGIYLPATPGEREVELILKHLATLGVKKIEDRVISEREDHYQIFLILGLFCLLLEMLVRRGKSPRMMPIPALLLIGMLHSGFISTPQEKVSQGNQDYEEKKYQSAVQKYREVQVKSPDSPPVEYNLATSLYKIDQYQESAAHLKNAVEKSSQDPELQAKAAYNYGNALYRVGDYEGAVEAYKKAIALNPQDKDAKYNLEFLLDKKSKFEKENQDRKKNNPDQKKNKGQDKQKDQKNQGSGGSSQDKNQSSGGQGEKNQGGGGSGQDKDQGDKNQDQKGSGQQDQNKDQGGQGQNQSKSGKDQDPNQKDKGEGQNQQDDKQQGDQSAPNKDQNQKSGGQEEKEQKENQSQDQKNKGDQQGQNENKDQDDQSQNKGSEKNDQPNQGNNSDADQQKQDSKSGGQDSKDKQESHPGDQKEQNQKPQNNQPGQDKGQGQEQGQQSPQKPSDQPGSQQGGQKPPSNQNPGQGQGGAAAGGEKGGDQKGVGPGKPLQGQMSKEDAEYLLSSLEDGEKNFHVLRKPAKESPGAPYVEKDW